MYAGGVVIMMETRGLFGGKGIFESVIKVVIVFSVAWNEMRRGLVSGLCLQT